MTSTGNKLSLLAKIIRLSTKGATEAEISNELSLSASRAGACISFLRGKRLLVLVEGGDYFPSEKGLVYLSSYDEASSLVDIEGRRERDSGRKPSGSDRGFYWDKAELAARMREIIDR